MRTAKTWLVVVVAGWAYALERVHEPAGAHAAVGDKTQKQQQQRRDPEAISPEHAELDVMAGEWEGVFRIWTTPDDDPTELRSEVERRWVLGGRLYASWSTGPDGREYRTLEGVLERRR